MTPAHDRRADGEEWGKRFGTPSSRVDENPSKAIGSSFGTQMVSSVSTRKRRCHLHLLVVVRICCDGTVFRAYPTSGWYDWRLEEFRVDWARAEAAFFEPKATCRTGTVLADSISNSWEGW